MKYPPLKNGTAEYARWLAGVYWVKGKEELALKLEAVAVELDFLENTEHPSYGLDAFLISDQIPEEIFDGSSFL